MAELGGGGTCDRWDAINATFTSKPIQTLFSIWLVFIFVLLSTKWEGVNFFFVEKDHIFLWISIPKVVLYDTKTFRYLFLVRWSLSSSVWDDHYHHHYLLDDECQTSWHWISVCVNTTTFSLTLYDFKHALTVPGLSCLSQQRAVYLGSSCYTRVTHTNIPTSARQHKILKSGNFINESCWWSFLRDCLETPNIWERKQSRCTYQGRQISHLISV